MLIFYLFFLSSKFSILDSDIWSASMDSVVKSLLQCCMDFRTMISVGSLCIRFILNIRHAGSFDSGVLKRCSSFFDGRRF